jgi:hypothetical protein
MIGKDNVAILQVMANGLGLVDAGCFSIGDSPERWVGVGKHPKADGVVCLVTLGNVGTKVFFTITDGDQDRIGRIMAAIEHYGRPGGHELHIGHSMPMSDPYALESGRVAAMLMAPDLFPGGGVFSTGLEIAGRHLDVVSVIFLDAEEYGVRRSHGAVALIERFEKDGRDCITFNAMPSATRMRH